MQIAVLMPFQNVERWIEEAIESILCQTHDNFVLVAIDDRSSDSSRSLIEAYSDPRIHVTESQRWGISAALNAGLEYAASQGIELCARMDADDVSAPDRLERQVAYLAANAQVGLLSTRYRRIDEDGNQIVSTSPAPWLDHADIIEGFRLGWNPIAHGSVMYRTSLVVAAGGYDDKLVVGEGYDLWVRLASSGCRFATLADELYLFRQRHGSATRSRRALGSAMMQYVQNQARERLARDPA